MTQMNKAQETPQKRKQLKLRQISSDTKYDNQFKINVFNYFLDDFPKTYYLSQDDTPQDLMERIVKDAKIRMSDIKKFKDEKGYFIEYDDKLSRHYQNDSNLNLEIYFNQDLKITINNKKISYFMCEDNNMNNENKFNDIFNAITNYHNSEKGGKIIVGVQPEDGLIKGINIPEQDVYKDDFIHRFNQKCQHKCNVLKNVEISFFRVKGQNKNQYNYHDHKKIMIIKIKGKNQQKNSSQCSTDDEESNFKTTSQEIQSKQSVKATPIVSQNESQDVSFLSVMESIEKRFNEGQQNKQNTSNNIFQYLELPQQSHQVLQNKQQKLFSTPQDLGFLDYLLEIF